MQDKISTKKLKKKKKLREKKKIASFPVKNIDDICSPKSQSLNQFSHLFHVLLAIFLQLTE